MKRMIQLIAVLLLTTSGIGCCYSGGGYDPCTGLAYGGVPQPVCGGPLDPLGIWCCGNVQNRGYNGGFGMMANDCCSGSYGAAVPQTFVNPNGCNGTTTNMQFPPGTTIQPMPNPMPNPMPTPMPDGKQPEGINSSCHLEPHPHSLPTGEINLEVNHRQWVKAH